MIKSNTIGNSDSLASFTSSAGREQHRRHASVNQNCRTSESLSKHRTNRQWVDDLTGLNGDMEQQTAHADLSAYLFVVSTNFLRRCYARKSQFSKLDPIGIGALAADYVQDFLLKLMNDNHALLDKYSGTGLFTSWAAQVIHNLIASDLRKARHRREIEATPETWQEMISEQESPEITTIRKVMGETLLQCMEELPGQYRMVIERCILYGESAVDVAKEENVSVNSIYIRLHRAKQQLRKFAMAAGLDPDNREIMGSCQSNRANGLYFTGP